ncbi:MAG: hypothetical protein Pg6B_09210 [Candidatus Azobacteroides pseudotrichonymphae]|jgi:hypothetical protein|nr:MAG: hypothetical protein Pg6B_09210 [Candidatus Azobacteroides pseudotrichonymphae]
MQGGGIDYNTLARLCHQAKRTNYTLDQLSELRSKLMEETFMWQIADEEWVTAVNWLKRKGIIKIEEKSNQRAVHWEYSCPLQTIVSLLGPMKILPPPFTKLEKKFLPSHRK